MAALEEATATVDKDLATGGSEGATTGNGEPRSLARKAKSFLRERAPALLHIKTALDGIAEDARHAWWSRHRPLIDAWLSQPRPRRLHLGAGAIAIEGWLNTDIDPRRGPAGNVFLDATKPFPLPDGCADCVFSEHMIEHLEHADGLAMLKECRRVLAPGGILRVATPDLTVLLGLHAKELSDVQQKYIRYITDHSIPGCPRYDQVFVINNNFRAWGHRFIYDQAMLRASLEEAGFVDIVMHRMGESADPTLAGLETHACKAGFGDMAAFETMCFEARAPKA